MDHLLFASAFAGCYICSKLVLPWISLPASRPSNTLFSVTFGLGCTLLLLLLSEIGNALSQSTRLFWWNLSLYSSVFNVIILLPFVQIHNATSNSDIRTIPLIKIGLEVIHIGFQHWGLYASGSSCTGSELHSQ